MNEIGIDSRIRNHNEMKLDILHFQSECYAFVSSFHKEKKKKKKMSEKWKKERKVYAA